MAAGPNCASHSVAPSSAYLIHGQPDLPDSDDDDDISWESDTECSDDGQWTREEQEDPAPNNYVELAADLGLPEIRTRIHCFDMLIGSSDVHTGHSGRQPASRGRGEPAE